jgi:hypothetical protein
MGKFSWPTQTAQQICKRENSFSKKLVFRETANVLLTAGNLELLPVTATLEEATGALASFWPPTSVPNRLKQGKLLNKFLHTMSTKDILDSFSAHDFVFFDGGGNEFPQTRTMCARSSPKKM